MSGDIGAKLHLPIKSGQSPYPAEPVTTHAGYGETLLLTGKHSLPNPAGHVRISFLRQKTVKRQFIFDKNGGKNVDFYCFTPYCW